MQKINFYLGKGNYSQENIRQLSVHLYFFTRGGPHDN
jgi:hypothetical protein